MCVLLIHVARRQCRPKNVGFGVIVYLPFMLLVRSAASLSTNFFQWAAKGWGSQYPVSNRPLPWFSSNSSSSSSSLIIYYFCRPLSSALALPQQQKLACLLFSSHHFAHACNSTSVMHSQLYFVCIHPGFSLHPKTKLSITPGNKLG